MGSHTANPNALNFIPYLECHNSRTKETIKLLIDSGANKNIIRPKIVTNTRKIKAQKIKNILGSQEVTSVGSIDLLGHDVPPQTYYILKFHEFFDGLLGSEFLARTGSIVNYKSMTLTIAKHKFKMKKYFPNIQSFCHTITIKTIGSGDWVIPSEMKLFNDISILPGIYKSDEGSSVVKIVSEKPEPPKNLPTFGPEFHAFETLKSDHWKDKTS